MTNPASCRMPSMRKLSAQLTLALSVSLAALLLVAPVAGAQTVSRTVSVSGSVSQLIPNDAAGFGFGVSAERKSSSAALKATSRQLNRVIAAVKSAGAIDPADIQTGRISVFKRTDPDTKKVTFVAGQSVKVIVRNLDKAGAVVDAAVNAGAGSISGPRFFAGDSEAAYEAALADAFDLAKQKATKLAQSAGLTLGPAVSINEQGGVSSIRSPSAGGAADEAAPSVPVKPGRSRVTARVRVVFEMQ